MSPGRNHQPADISADSIGKMKDFTDTWQKYILNKGIIPSIFRMKIVVEISEKVYFAAQIEAIKNG
jgi:hypothetical protein